MHFASKEKEDFPPPPPSLETPAPAAAPKKFANPLPVGLFGYVFTVFAMLIAVYSSQLLLSLQLSWASVVQMN
jgi:succinate-acetate transporter protein